MHDVLVHYLEVNFPEIADQLAHARGREPSNDERAAAGQPADLVIVSLAPAPFAELDPSYPDKMAEVLRCL